MVIPAQSAAHSLALPSLAPPEPPLLPLGLLAVDYEYDIAGAFWGVARGHGWILEGGGHLWGSCVSFFVKSWKGFNGFFWEIRFSNFKFRGCDLKG